MAFARWVLTIAGVFGVLTVAPMFALEGAFSRGTPLSHPEHYYGFAAVTLAWQLTYLFIARDPARYRPIILLGAAGKLMFVVAVWSLYAAGRTPLPVALFTLADLVIAGLFVAASARLGRA